MVGLLEEVGTYLPYPDDLTLAFRLASIWLLLTIEQPLSP
jgi:hypothetical protein